ncbi:hypothetical protein CTheo_9045 [Ceratobasidium theobromae]|uniref:Uncharacterized protein n=1 Tax=Ceratobasidium theobromae TaxID=1582974 RepID=A0A5N5Q7Y1_9AGAM|nr:hypothetical protein CTheo_9045 [Ceratobasidium theobromae]
MGHDTTSITKIKYTNYDQLVDQYHVVLRGYPIHPNGQIIRPSDFPGGVKGLLHADMHLGDGTWGFEKVSNAVYKEWKAQCNQATIKNTDRPTPPYIPVQGTEFKNGPQKTGGTETGTNKRRRPAEPKKIKADKVRKADSGKGKKVATKVKSRATIEDSDKESDEESAEHSDEESAEDLSAKMLLEVSDDEEESQSGSEGDDHV